MKERQQDAGRPRCVRKPDFEGAAATVSDAHIPDLPGHQGLGAGLQIGDRRQPGAILVAQRQMEQQVLDRGDADLGEPLHDLWTHTAQPVHGHPAQGLGLTGIQVYFSGLGVGNPENRIFIGRGVRRPSMIVSSSESIERHHFLLQRQTPMNADRLYKNDMISFVRRLRRFSQIVLFLICENLCNLRIDPSDLRKADA